jgi:hypothetical protein
MRLPNFTVRSIACTPRGSAKAEGGHRNSAVPNAFATGRNQKHAVVAVTSSLLQQLEEPEVEAVRSRVFTPQEQGYAHYDHREFRHDD